MAYLQKHGAGWRVCYYEIESQRRCIYLGKCSHKQAKELLKHFEALHDRQRLGVDLPTSTELWSRNVKGSLRQKLLDCGLLRDATPTAAPMTLDAWITKYLDARRGTIADRTLQRLSNSCHKLRMALGSKYLADVTEGDAQRYLQNLMLAHKPSHAGKLVRDARSIFTAAIADRLLTDNPFAGMKTSHAIDKSREAYVSQQVIEEIAEAATTPYATLLILARYAGLRVPSEPLAMKWQDVDLPAGRMKIHAPKTKSTRIMPIFPRVRQALEDQLELTGDSEYVFTHARKSAAKTWRKATLDLIERSGHPTWPKLFQNIRASARSDMLAEFPEFIVNYWLNHSSAVGAKHYERISDDWYEKAADTHQGANRGANQGANTRNV